MRARRLVILDLWLALTALLTVSCSDPVSPGVQPEISNLTDNFQFQVTSMSHYSQTLEYQWQNTGTMANVDQSCAITAGAATLVLLDAAGTQVYTRSLSEGGSAASATGVAGNWRVRIVCADTGGTLNFRVQRRTP